MSISLAIAQHRLLIFTYDGTERIVEPHIYGVDARGEPLLSAYQVEGGSRSGQPAGWRLFRMDKMIGLRVLDQHFAGPRPDYQPDDGLFATIQHRL
ncbi:putative DNA-binding transcriptional regulator YafY [Luteibacter sp. Sphag1AF]|uniref:WYL domain-containing protein n=1 Tax=Luteibacter sp. Sphag1AF TaxID=2587031 RepID=UPI00161BE830|nr:WYL domain-containing protein [Luteibacter sp. Sphag1AF]MBB3229105.1 putative DNA-binding transcriptional regulator YafY [Luteibacter sp. Sphag1AF]